MKRNAILVSLSILISFLISSCGGTSAPSGPTQTPDPCSPTEVQKYIDAIDDVERRFDDAYTLANSTARGSLSPVIGELQAIRRDAEDLDVPSCAEKARDNLVIYMDAVIEGFLLFLSNESDEKVGSQFITANTYFKNYLNSLANLSGD